MTDPKFEIDIYQISGDELFRKNRHDGTGWEWRWADWRRDWMDNSASSFAYRCLPLSIANQIGWWLLNPVGLTATWNGDDKPGSVAIVFDTAADVWRPLINSHFGLGVLTWNTPFLFRTKPAGSRLLVTGPANYFMFNLHPLTAVIETDWLTASFTMNYKVLTPYVPVRVNLGEPLLQIIPLANNFCADLQSAHVTFRKLADDPEINAAYLKWAQMRKDFHARKESGEIGANAWQKNYFQGKDMEGNEAAPAHIVRLKPPVVQHIAPGGTKA